MSRTCSIRFLLASYFVLSFAVAQATPIPQRVSTAIDNSQRLTLRGNIPPAASHAVDLGAVAPGRVLPDMSLRFTMTAAQQSALDQLLLDQQNPASPRYHQWLTPEQFGAQFGLAPADLARVSAWLTAQGFTVQAVARGGSFIRFSGTVAQAQSAFGVTLHNLSFNGEPHFANLTEPSLPAAVAVVSAAITGLHDFHPQPHNHKFSVIAPNPANGSAPSFTSSTSGNHYIAPGDFYTIYDETALLLNGINGTSVTIGVMGQTDIHLADIAAFRSASGLSPSVPAVVLYGSDPGYPSNGDLTEAELDVEWSGATAPGASILFVNSTDVIDGSLTQAIDNNLAPILTVSYGLCEAGIGASLLNSYNSLIQMANAQGQAVVAAAGDSGATDCDTGTYASQGLAVDFPASLPTVVGVGGTMFNEGTGTYFSATNNNNSGSAVSYIPEAVWNEDATAGSLASGGGGVSGYFAKPSWQVGAGVPADGSRDVPDISLNAAAIHDPYLMCMTGYCTNGYRNSTGYLSVVGGTSVGAPAFAGLLALVVQQTGSRLGNPNPKIYALANSTYYGSVFHDVVIGNNSSPCATGSTNCPNGGSIGYTAAGGYDLATGWGSVDAYNMVSKWNLVTAIGTSGGLTVSTTTLSGAASTAVAGTPIAFTASVTSGSTITTTTPTGSVQIFVDNVAYSSAVALTSGSATYSLDTTNIAAGTHTVTAIYSGSSTYAGSKSAAFSITITASPTALFTLSPPTVSFALPAGTSTSVALTLASVGNFAGTVQLSATGTAPLRFSLSSTSIALASGGTSGATLTINAYSTRSALPTAPGSLPQRIVLGSGIALAGLLYGFLPKRRRFAGLLAAIMSASLLAVAGCGGTGTAAALVGTTNTPSGTYTINVTATATSGTNTVSHSSLVTVIVQ